MSIKKIAGQVKLWNTLDGTAPDGYNNIEFSEIALKTDVTAAVGGAALSAADTETDGYLTSEDWNTFNGKQDELSAADTETDGYLTSTDWNTFNDKQDANTQQDLLDTLGIPGPYDDDTAAATGGVAVGGLYYVTTTLVLQVRVA